ncbi:MAG: hypothetical protein Q9M17_02115 [Mariprofundus sp.]|nr:hypothetical protein [Mariprofundus sp.]
MSNTPIPHPFYAISWRGTWLPLLAALAFHRGIIIALPNTLASGVKISSVRCMAHGLLCLLGFLLFSWSLAHQMPTGLPPLHHWWSKVLMFFNLCMACLHLLPLPGLLAGELLLSTRWGDKIPRYFNIKHGWIVITVLAASPLLDLLLGASVVFPIYEWMSSAAIAMAR